MASMKIQELDPIEHILKRPDMYVGSVRNKEGEEYVADFKKGEDNEKVELSIKKEKITFSPAMLRIFVEALSNAIDNVQRSKDAGVPCTKIKVSINKETGETSVWNDGLVIPIEKNENGTLYKHTMIFGKLRTSTNFNDDEERTVSGRNGLGIKLTNVFSSYFKIKAVDPKNEKAFVQEWKNNMREVGKVKIGNSTLKKGYTEVSWIPDFEHFKMPNGYTDDIIRLYTRYVFDAAMLTKVNVYLNDEKLPIKSLQDYSKLFSSPYENSIYIKGKDSEVVLTTSKDFEAVSFVNGVFTMNGGKHVDGWSEAIFRPIVEHFNKPNRPQVNIKDVRQFFRLFVVSTLVNPEFSSQSKTELTAPDVKAEVEKKFINNILKWECTKQIGDIIKGKEMLVMKKVEKKRGYNVIEGYDPANEAGGKHASQCTLALCEGLSAKTFAIKGMDSPLFGKTGRDWFGVYALRGKILNVRKANPKSISENREITSIIQALGLKYDVDYTKDENFNNLNYGRLLILTDADTDGKHIAGLIMNFIHYLFPTLLQREKPFLVDMMTPIARFIIKGSDEKVFYDLNRADEYYKGNVSRGIKVKYYKGLGTHSDDEIADVFGKRVISFVRDEKADDNITKVFNSDTHSRKEWIEKYDPNIHTEIDENTLEKNISTFIDEELITFSIDDCKRSLPSLMDGLKQSQRKILYAAFLKNLKTNSLKVAQFAGYIAENTNYHHGEQNLYNTIVKMAQEFVGSNNIPLFTRDGQFGARVQNGEDAAAARYIFTKLEKITRYIFREEDDVLLDRVIDDGDMVEPKFYMPILPLVLINGCDGIGTGWSCSIPAFNPLDISRLVRNWINNEKDEDKKIIPWYRGFTGEIKDVGKGKFITEGVCGKDGKNVIVSEIPVGMSIQSFYDKLQEMMKEKKIKDLKNLSGANKAMFIITESNDGLLCSVESLKLTSSLNVNNMVMFDENDKIKKYESIDEIIDSFCKQRMKYYTLRKEYMIKDIEKKIRISKNKMRFIEDIMNDKIILKRKKESVIILELEKAGYDKEDDSYNYLLGMNIRVFTEEKIEELKENIRKLEEELEKIKKTEEKEMWIEDLEDFEKAYGDWLDDISESEKKSESRRKKKTDNSNTVKKSVKTRTKTK